LIPRELSSTEDRLSYIRQAREGLQVLLKAFDREEGDLAEESKEYGDRLAKSRSEGDFDKIERSEASPDRSAGKPRGPERTVSGGWMPWNWSSKEADRVGAEKKDEGPVEDVPAVAKSSGVDLG
jgi:hypothetical protein